MQLDSIVSQDTLDWLLEPENPSVRFWALQQLQNRPSEYLDVIEAQDAIMESSCVKTILGKQTKEGYWGKYDDMYLPKYTTTTHNLLILAELGAKRTPQIEKALEYIFLFQRDSGHFLTERPRTDKGRASEVKDGCCFDGNILFYLNHFGYLSDSRTQRLIDFQIDYHSDDLGGWKCRAFPINRSGVFPENCFMGGMKVLKAISRIPTEHRSKDLNRIIDQEVEIVLDNGIFKYLRNPDGSRKEKAGWKRFGFPLFYQSDILEVLDILTELGVRDDRMQESIDYVITMQEPSGRWLLKNTYNGKMLCQIEEKDKSSKWITLRAARVLSRYLK
ncbi:nitrogen fixation protein NifH [Candidatus Thorarchaeota archaeon]|nr:MAG: nitrogen fixation protein NifH [Candidatus Thorarchaeota archaeon]